jgi:hypothetical protein
MSDPTSNPREFTQVEIEDEWKMTTEPVTDASMPCLKPSHSDLEVRASKAEADLAAAREALKDCLQEIDELGAAFTRERKKSQPDYVVYISWARPAGLRALSAGRQKNWGHES